MPISATFGRYEFKSPGGMVRKGSARWQLVPLYPIHAAQLVAAGNTFAGLVESPDDDYADGEHYAFIEPLESEHEITLDMVRLKRAAIESIAEQYPAASSGTPKNDEHGEIRKRGTFVAEVTSFWPTIEQDLSDSGRNGLNDVAKHQDHGFWKVEPAIKWATERGKINKGKAQSFIASNKESYLSPMLRILLKLD